MFSTEKKHTAGFLKSQYEEFNFGLAFYPVAPVAADHWHDAQLGAGGCLGADNHLSEANRVATTTIQPPLACVLSSRQSSSYV
ncbi:MULTISPECIES: hypothetical protein [unclassified Undibacterium]|uniref:hypothetical protein n=1 Tax=unclassified Undibacterium TaxID=2630295 RepID=UPI002AC96672|nr:MULTISPECIES: hypothetical protein [unclassified Undibacterium]MEB0177549.1 hypothetical protein [Undibacterium sp. CCC3.4]WPX45709.1 hypothetical protein RHM61_15865 [Undibacterium sp. CCC3.4]